MKIFKILSALFLVASIISCGNEYDTSEYFDLEELPGYVAFDASGNEASIPPFEVTEADGSLSVTVECPTGTMSDININYSLGGDAVFGTDYSISGADSNGGSVTLSNNVNDVARTDRTDIVIELLTDEVVDGTKTIEITLTSANNANGEVAVGRGGKDFLKTAIVNIADVDM